MRNWKPTVQSIYSLLGAGPKSDAEIEDALGDIQESMLHALGDEGARLFPGVARRIKFASDLQSLWYLRGDLMAALAEVHDETHARAAIATISKQFQGMLPRGLSTRSSPLGK